MRTIAIVSALLGLIGTCPAAENGAGTPLNSSAPDRILKIWPSDAPGLIHPQAPETIGEGMRIRNVSVPELWVYLPKQPGTNRPAVMICPGGGFGHLSVGTHVQRAVQLFNDKGIVTIGLKYRTKYGKNDPAKDSLADCIQAMRQIRLHAKEWGIDQNNIGIQGYSAGGTVCINLLGHFDAGDPNSPNAVARESSRPDFIALMCPWPNQKPAAAYPILADPPPVFIASAEDDTIAPAAFALEIASALRAKGGETSLFIVPKGGHAAFHLGVSQGIGTSWPTTVIPMIMGKSSR
jgi:acetyl esterase/lipase